MRGSRLCIYGRFSMRSFAYRLLTCYLIANFIFYPIYPVFAADLLPDEAFGMD
ncbi:hypothetical protein RsTz2092_01850 [Deferribacterales bacterium RsTz2092]|nr:hypothetical protein AGMMS49941_02140 [Deferribacterales bacterium]